MSAERGPSGAWAARSAPELEPWERSPTLNGTTIRRWRELVREQGWRVVREYRRPILTDGRRARQQPWRTLARAVAPLAHMPLAEELFLGRICEVLER